MNIIKEFREDKLLLTPEEFSKSLGISPSTLWRWEHSSIPGMTLRLRRKFKEIYGFDPVVEARNQMKEVSDESLDRQ